MEIITPRIFSYDTVIAGVTKKNELLFPETGFSISHGKTLNDAQVEQNRNYLASFLNIAPNALKCQKQVHGVDIQIVDEHTACGIHDGMISNTRGIVLCVCIADCCAVLLHDKATNSVAALHSGWRGTAQNITKKGIEMMQENFGTNPKDLMVYLSPCACGQCYEVGWDVAKFFPNSVVQIAEDKFLFDNHKQIVMQLNECGVENCNIGVAQECTIEDRSLHSFRRDGDKSGRMGAFIGLL